MKRAFAAVSVLFSLVWAQAVFAAANVAPTGPSKVSVGQTFQVVVMVNGAADVDTIRLNGSYTQDLLEWKGATPSGVFQNVSPGTYVDQKTGIFSFGAFTLSSHANGSARLAVLTFRAIKAGSAYVQLTTGSRILSAGEDQMGTVGRLPITVEEKVLQPEQPVKPPSTVTPGQAVISLFSTSHPDPNAWYANNQVLVGWTVTGREVKSYTVGFDQSPEGPAEQIPTDNLAKFIAEQDGVWYAHLGVNFKDKTYQRTDLRIQIDRSPPHSMYPIVDQTNVSPFVPNALRYGTIDDVSGVGRYDISIDGQFVTSTLLQAYDLKGLGLGSHKVVVKAFDLANNSVEGQTSFNLVAVAAPPSTQSAVAAGLKALLYTLFALLLLIFVWLWERSRREKKKKVHR